MMRWHGGSPGARAVWLLAAALSYPAATASAALLRVSPGVTGAFATIQAAVDAAAPGDSVELAPGLYRGPGNVEIDFRGKPMTLRSRDGDPRGCVIDGGGLQRGFSFVTDEGPGTIVEGLSVINGAGEPGGAARCWRGASPTLRDCIFANCATPIMGGAVCCVLNASPTFERCTFARNSANVGGALACWTGSRPVLRACVFTENRAASGGAIECADDATVSLEDCTFWRNQAQQGGALICRERSRARLAGCTLCANGAPEGGGGLCCESEGEAALERTLIAFGTSGGAIEVEPDAGATLVSCDLFGNEGGDWDGRVASQLREGGNFRADPLFCDQEKGDLKLQPRSPCLPGSRYNPTGGLIGAHPGGCEP